MMKNIQKSHVWIRSRVLRVESHPNLVPFIVEGSFTFDFSNHIPRTAVGIGYLCEMAIFADVPRRMQCGAAKPGRRARGQSLEVPQKLRPPGFGFCLSKAWKIAEKTCYVRTHRPRSARA